MSTGSWRSGKKEKTKLILLQKFKSFWMEKNLFETQGRLEESQKTKWGEVKIREHLQKKERETNK